MSIENIKFDNYDIEKALCKDETIWSGSDDKTGSPGPKRLIGGNMQAGFFGEVPTSELITGDELARRIGLTAGEGQFSNEPWLKFSYMGKTEFVAKKPFRHSISWNAINNVSAVFGSRTIKIGSQTYKVRLMKGKTEGKQSDSSSYGGVINHGSEWNKLMLPIHENAPSNWNSSYNNVKLPTENWNIGYTDNDLFTKGNMGNRSWCQEYGENKNYRLIRGHNGTFYSSSSIPSNRGSAHGWRPVLELVE